MSMYYQQTWMHTQLRRLIERAKPGDVMYMLGATGVGKTRTIREVCNEIASTASIFHIDGHNCANLKDLKDLLQKQFTTNLIAQIQSQSSEHKRIIVIDEFEVLYQHDRAIMSYIATITPERHVLIVISNISLEKRIKTHVPDAMFTYYNAMSEADICVLLRVQFPDETYASILNAAEQCYGNITQAIHMIRMKHQTNQTDHIRKRALKFEDLFSLQPRNDVIEIVSEDSWLVPLRYHENIHKKLVKTSAGHAAYRRLMAGMCNWDIMMQRLSDDTSIPTEYFASLVTTTSSYCKKSATDAVNDFTKMLSNLSLQKKNEKNMYSCDTDFQWMHSQIFCDNIKYK